MITQPTVFILGAGASMPYKYPSGNQLKDKVIEKLSNTNSSEYSILNIAGFGDLQISEFRKTLNYSGRPSVDAFLEYRPEFMTIGKLSIASILINYENIDSLYNCKDNWYEYLFQKMNTKFEEFEENTISFITFNYDRSLETYLFEALSNSYGKSAQEVANVISKIKIIHVHGILSELPWQNKDGRPYGPTSEIIKIKQSAEAIRVVHEESQIEEAFKETNKLFYNSDLRIILLGFGFHKTNLERLGLHLNMDIRRRYYASVYGFTQLEQNEILNMFSPYPVEFGVEVWKVLEFLREKIVL